MVIFEEPQTEENNCVPDKLQTGWLLSCIDCMFAYYLKTPQFRAWLNLETSGYVHPLNASDGNFLNFKTRLGITRVNPIHQKAFSFTDSGQHLGDKIGIVPIVIIGIGKNIDKNINNKIGTLYWRWIAQYT